jgi:hypothetical protein
MSPGASKQLEGMCTSVVIAKDMIPRLSIKTFQHLRDQMMRAAALCKLPKAKVGCRLGLRAELVLLLTATVVQKAQAWHC